MMCQCSMPNSVESSSRSNSRYTAALRYCIYQSHWKANICTIMSTKPVDMLKCLELTNASVSEADISRLFVDDVTELIIDDVEGLDHPYVVDMISSMSQLKRLVIRNTELDFSEGQIWDFNACKQLEVLKITGTNMSTLPEIEHCVNLREIQLTLADKADTDEENSLEDVDWSALSALESLSITDSELLGPIPEWIGELSSLEVLNLSGNYLSSIPHSISNLTRLRVLDLSYNDIVDGLQNLVGMTRLETVKLNNNLFSGFFYHHLLSVGRSGVHIDISENASFTESSGKRTVTLILDS